MSEFSSAVLVPVIYEQQLRAHLESIRLAETVGLVHPVNDTWIGLFMADLWLAESDTLAMLENMANQLPFMYFSYADDHGWTMLVFSEGKNVFSAAVVWDPDSRASLSGTDLDAFLVFGFSDRVISQLQDLFSNQQLLQSADGVRRLKQVLQLDEFEWLSYDYLIDEVLIEEQTANDSTVGDAIRITRREANVEANLSKFISVIVRLVTDFLGTHQHAVDRMVGQAKVVLETGFEYYKALDDSEKEEYIELMCWERLTQQGLLYGRRDKNWLQTLEEKGNLYRAKHKFQKQAIVDEKLASLPPSTYILDVPKELLPRGRQATKLIQQIVLERFPERWLNPRGTRAVGLGDIRRGRQFDAYLFPSRADANDVLWIEYDQRQCRLKGGFGNARHNFYSGFALPCWAFNSGYYSVEGIVSMEALQTVTWEFCSMLSIVYPYHKRLWEGYLGSG